MDFRNNLLRPLRDFGREFQSFAARPLAPEAAINLFLTMLG